MSIRKSYRGTLAATYIGHITQAVANSIIAILFLVFKSELGITDTQFTILVTVNFGVQLLVDFLCARFMDRFNYRIPMVLAQTCAGVGFISLGFLPFLLGDVFLGFLIATVIFAIGGGMTEVMLSPIVQACPTENKQAHMNILHSFYCWGCLLAVVVSSLFLWLVGSDYWYLLAALWAIIPLVAGILFALVPLDRPTDQIPPEKRITFGGLFKRPVFWIFIIMMACAGASEQAMYQNAAGYVKDAVGCSDLVAGLVAPGMFALCMGLSRIVTARLNRTVSSEIIMMVSSVLCAVAYVLAALWAIIPLVAGILFALVPLDRPTDQIPPEKRISFGGLFKRPIFWIFIIMMACAGASEQAMYQNAAGYVKQALGCSDLVAGLAAPGMFALFMGLSRIVTARLNRTISSEIIMLVSGVLCAVAYAMAALNVWGGLALVSCALCGFSIGIFWPGTFSFAADRLSGGGTALFALLAMGGDLGGVAGPALVNLVPASLSSVVKSGMLCSIIFPIGLMLCVLFLKRAKRN